MDAWTGLVEHFRGIATLDGARAALGWDQQTYMPPKAATARGEQLTLLTEILHERVVDPRVLRWVDELSASDLNATQAAGIRNLKRMVDREVQVPAELVARLARLQSEGFTAWIDAKARSDWAGFAPLLDEILQATIERARAIDPHRHPYDVLLEEYDPGTTVASLKVTFARLQAGLTELLAAIAAAPPIPDTPIALPVDRQLPFHREVAAALGYDFDGGRLDFAEHPFSTTLGTGDVRITTHLHAHDVLGGLSGTIHEAGHGMYEQGLPRELVGPLPQLLFHPDPIGEIRDDAERALDLVVVIPDRIDGDLQPAVPPFQLDRLALAGLEHPQ